MQAEVASATSREESSSEATDHTSTPAFTTYANGISGSRTIDVPATPQASTTDEEKARGYINLYGFAEVDLGYNFTTIDPNWFDVMRPSKLPSSPGAFGKNGSTFFSVRPSRFGTQGMYPTPWGEMTLAGG